MIVVSDAKSRTDGPAFQMLSQVNSAIPIVLMARTHRFKFNEDLLRLGKYILFEFSEMGWDWKFTDTHEWGKNTDQFPQFADDEYKKFDDWVASNPPLLTFTRELLKKDVTEVHLPIDYVNWHTTPEPVSKEQFEKRLVGFFHFFGRSHEGRLKAHSDAWAGASKYGYSICDNLFLFNKFMENEDGRKVVSLWQPHYGRVDISNMLQISAMSKITFALAGAGRKTFRHLEASLNSTMLMWADEIAWAYPWLGGYNCIKCNEGSEIDCVFEVLNDPILYEIYLNGVDTCKRYEAHRYVKEHVESNIIKL